jgi:hypothetical protein
MALVHLAGKPRARQNGQDSQGKDHPHVILHSFDHENITFPATIRANTSA